MYELEDAQEHLTTLISEMSSRADYDEVNLRIDLGHVFAHLNRAWHLRHLREDLDQEQWQRAGQFPKAGDPISCVGEWLDSAADSRAESQADT